MTDKERIKATVEELEALGFKTRSDIMAEALWDFIMANESHYYRDFFDEMYEDAGWVRRE